MRPWLTSGRLLPGPTLQVLSLKIIPGLVQQVSCVQLQNKTMSVAAADNVGILKLKMLVMESIKEFPRGINSDQVISKSTYDGESERAPGPGLKRQASSNKLREIQASSGKHQAPSTRVQAPSRKRQAPGPWTLEKVLRYSDQGPLPR